MVKNSYNDKKNGISLYFIIISILLLITFIVTVCTASYSGQIAINHWFVLCFVIVTFFSCGIVAMASGS